MILRYPFLRRNVTEHATLLLIVSAHVLLDAATPSSVPAYQTFSAACEDRPLQQDAGLPDTNRRDPHKPGESPALRGRGRGRTASGGTEEHPPARMPTFQEKRPYSILDQGGTTPVMRA